MPLALATLPRPKMPTPGALGQSCSALDPLAGAAAGSGAVLGGFRAALLRTLGPWGPTLPRARAVTSSRSARKTVVQLSKKVWRLRE